MASKPQVGQGALAGSMDGSVSGNSPTIKRRK